MTCHHIFDEYGLCFECDQRRNEMKTPSQYRIPGHKVTYATNGANSGYWVARCTCGWRAQGWHDKKRSAVREAAGHMRRSALNVTNGETK